MNADIQDVGPCRKRITVEMDTAEVNAAFESSLIEVQGMAQLPGFRKGKAPRKMLERRFGDHITDGVRERLFRDGFVGALKENDLSPLGDPDVDVEALVVTRGEAFTFSTEVDVRPKFELAEYKGIELNEEIEEVTDEETDERLEELRQRFAENTDIDTPAAAGELVEGDFAIVVEEEEIVTQKERAVRIEGTTIFGIEVGDMAGHFGGSTPGDTKVLQFDMPDDYPNEELRGKPATLTFNVTKVLETELPELDDAFASRLGMTDLDTVRGQIRQSIEMDRKNASRQQLEESLVDALLELNTFDLPAALVEKQADLTYQQNRMRMMYTGTPEEALEAQEEELRTEALTQAERQLRRMILFDVIADKEEITVNEQDFQRHLTQLANAYGRSPAEVLKDIQDRNGLDAMQSEIKDIKVTQAVLDTAKILVNGVEPEQDAPEEEAPEETPADAAETTEE